MNINNEKTIKVSSDTWRRLKSVTLDTGEKIYQIIERLIKAEQKTRTKSKGK